MSTQLALFSDAPRLQPPSPSYHPGLATYAFLYTATAKGNNSGIRFMLSLAHAQQWCESPVSRGRLHGTEWAYFYTTVENFLSCHWGPKEQRIDLDGLSDNGTWDARIAATGLRKISLWEFADVLRPLGVSVLNAPAAPTRRERAA